jgi:hypothetical protein
MSLYQQAQAHNDNAKEEIQTRIAEMLELLQWYRDILRNEDPGLSVRDRRCLMFAIARAVDSYRANLQHPQGILLAVQRHFAGRA